MTFAVTTLAAALLLQAAPAGPPPSLKDAAPDHGRGHPRCFL